MYEVDEELGLKGNVLGFSTIVKGDADSAIEGADVVAVEGSLRDRVVEGRADRAAGDPRRVARRPGDGLEPDPGSLRRPRGRRPCPAAPRGPRANRRPAARGGFGSKCDFHFEGHVAALARAAGRPVKSSSRARRSLSPPTTAARGWSSSSRRRPARRQPRGSPRSARPRRRCLLRRGRFLRADGGDARRRPVRGRERQRRVDARVHEQPRLPARSARRRRRRFAGRWSSSTWTSSPRALDLDPVELRRRTLVQEGDEADPSGLRADLHARDA